MEWERKTDGKRDTDSVMKTRRERNRKDRKIARGRRGERDRVTQPSLRRH